MRGNSYNNMYVLYIIIYYYYIRGEPKNILYIKLTQISNYFNIHTKRIRGTLRVCTFLFFFFFFYRKKIIILGY